MFSNSVGVSETRVATVSENGTNGRTPAAIVPEESPEILSGIKKAMVGLPSNKEKLTLFAAELIGTAMLVFMGCTGCIGATTPFFNIAFAFGITIMVIIMVFGHISGAHLNPAVTIAAVFLDVLAYPLAPIYMAGQIIGGVLGFGLIRVIIPMHFWNSTAEPGLCSTVPSPHVSTLQALAIEILATMVLIFVCAAVWDHRNSLKHDSVSLRFGLTITGLALIFGPYTGCSMNPARTLGPALFNGDWDQHWIYWVGPMFSGVAGAVFYKTLFARPLPEDDVIDPTDDVPLNTVNSK